MKNKLKILQVAPLFESVPPKTYGGTERVVSYITEELVKQGHEVTLFASGDSLTSANLIPQCENSLRTDSTIVDYFVPQYLMVENFFKIANEFDVIHSHIDYHLFTASRRITPPVLTTLHGRLNIPQLKDIYKEYSEVNVASISFDQRTPLLEANWAGNVYHGLPKGLYDFQENPGEYLAFIGRISPEKRVDTAIKVAIATNTPIKIAAKIDKVDQEYFDNEIKSLMEHPLVEYIGEIGEKEKNIFLGNSKALIFPIDWAEPFGLVMIEAMACGTPVVAMRRGSVPEVMEHGKSGFICNDFNELVEAVKNIGSIKRADCREVFEKRFTSEVMTKNYINLYSKLIEERELSSKSRILQYVTNNN